jgi:hypothetical protein
MQKLNKQIYPFTNVVFFILVNTLEDASKGPNSMFLIPKMYSIISFIQKNLKCNVLILAITIDLDLSF